ncbi:MAG: BACON domain-containing protein [Muribaculaceae bacterium]|nr:BACON domain-containing protein [Muribaculaceae bacterium]
MNKLLLLTAGLSVAVTAMGQTVNVSPAGVTQRVETGRTANIVKRANSRVADVVTEKGAVMKRFSGVKPIPGAINPLTSSKAPVRKVDALDDSDVLFESFEGWDGATETWVPEGWTVESYGDKALEAYQKWHPSAAGGFYPAPTDGQYYFGIIYGNNQNEWLISPAVTPTAGNVLTFDMNIEPLWFYNLDQQHFNFDDYEFIGTPEVVFNVKVNVREVGGEWSTALDMADKFKDMTGMEMLMYNSDASLMPFSVDLSAYAGKEIQVAFQYVGDDGQSYFIDNIRIGCPALEPPVYVMPYSTQYWGFTRDLNSVNMGVATLPVFTDLIWTSYDYVDGATYTWEYNDPENTDNWITVEDDDMLIASYGTDYTSEFTTRNNLYYLPKLTISAPGASSATYQNPANYMQMGGKADFLANTSTGDKVMLNMGLVPFNRVTEGLGTYTYREDFGMPIIPIFGHDANVDKFWTDYTFQGEEEEGEGVKLTSILNFIYSAGSPTVVTATDLFAYTSGIGENVEFTCNIYPVDDSFQPMLDAPVASATLLGKDITVLDEGDQSPDLSCLTFEFANAAVLDDTYPAYVVMISGFNSDEVAYFCPLQSLYPSDAPLALGWIAKDITFQGETRTSYSPMTDAEGEPMYTSFAINLEAYLPWLQCETEEIEISDNGTTVGLNSYYAAEDYTVSAPDWAQVTLEGRYGATTLTANAEYSEAARQGEVTISAPGVSKTFTLNQAAGTGISGIGEISAESDAIEAVYNLNGQKVNAANLPAGVYMIKRANGNAQKAIVK